MDARQQRRRLEQRDRDDEIVEQALEGLLGDRVAASVAAAAELRHLASLAALATAQTARIASRDSREREMPWRSLAGEIGAALHISDRTAQRLLGEAAALVERFPATVDALERGAISRGHAMVILEAGTELTDDAVRAAWEEVVLNRAQGDSAGRLRAYARELAESVHPRGMVERHAEAKQNRSVSVTDLADGMAQLVALLPAAEAHGIADRLTRQGRVIIACRDADPADRDAGTLPGLDDDSAEPLADVRTLEQVRADVLTDMLLTGAPRIDPTLAVLPGGLGGIKAHVQVTLPAALMTGRADRGASLDSGCSVDPVTALLLAGNAPVWDRLFLDPTHGTVVEVDQYRQGRSQDRFLKARDRWCRFPGCRARAVYADIDHTEASSEGGPTSIENLACLCRRHHTMKHATEWDVQQVGDGSLIWTSPTSRCYIDNPPPRVAFAPDGEPAPF